jgi:hypothetical protein
MKALHQPAAVPPIAPASPLTLPPPSLEIPKSDILPRNLLDNSRTEPPNELLKTKGREIKDVKNEGSSQ